MEVGKYNFLQSPVAGLLHILIEGTHQTPQMKAKTIVLGTVFQDGSSHDVPDRVCLRLAESRAVNGVSDCTFCLTFENPPVCVCV